MYLERGKGRLCSTMGWEQRGKYSYYYRKERNGRCARSVYLGRGETAALVSKLDAVRGAEQVALRREVSQAQRDLELIDYNIDSIGQLISMVTEGVLLVAGFHQHRRQWRKRSDEHPNDHAYRGCEPVKGTLSQCLMKANKEHPRKKDVEALRELLAENKSMLRNRFAVL